jgi:ACS family sodium-dependent inorganic phosphate cotransporter
LCTQTFQGVVLSSFFGGYALTQILGGQLADKLGGKVVLAAGVSLWSFFTLVTPEVASLGAAPLIGARILLGVGEGVAFPSIHSLIARNVPQESQSTAVGIVTAASYVGTALAFGVSPLIISSLGWQYVFYLFAALALLWLPLWIPVKTADRTKSATKRSSDEDGLTAETEGLLARQQAGSSSSSLASTQKTQSGFWGLMRRKEVWAICAAQYCQSWGMYGLLNWLPTFFK